MLERLFYLTLTVGLVCGLPTKNEAPTCGYNACDVGKPGMLNIHLVPHGHCDTGWDKTVDQYYYGSRNNLQNVGIQYNLDAVIQGLYFGKHRRFTWIEVAYFWRWWGEQDANMKTIVKSLVAEGRLMFGNNAWCMNDEASTYYQEIIDQHTIGQRFLMDTFGMCARPMTAWQIDTFGHSREMASLLAQMGHDSLYFGRLDYQDWSKRAATKSMQLLWHGSDDLGSSSDLLTGVLYNSYLPPNHFIWSQGNDPIMDDRRLYDYNVDAMVDLFLKEVTQWAKAYPTNHVLVPMGIDFDYELANRWFINEDKLIKYTNARQAKGSKVNLIYSTIPCYTYALHSANYTFTTKTDEFFPYASRDHTFWTGSFTSRPTIKGYVRDCNAFLQAVKQLSVLSGLSDKPQIDSYIDFLRRGLAININHGQLPGTQKQVVAYDNVLRLSNGSIEAMKAVEAAYDTLTAGTLAGQVHCPMLNISECSVSETSAGFSVTFYNPSSWPVYHWASIPVAAQNVALRDSRGNSLAVQIQPVSSRTKTIPERSGKALYEAVFNAPIPAMGFSTFFFTRSTTEEDIKEPYLAEPEYFGGKASAELVVENEYLRLNYDSKTGLLKTVTDLKSGSSFEAEIDLRYYTSFVGNNQGGSQQSSGSYIFRPKEQVPFTFPTVNTSIVRGPLVQEIHQEFANWATLVTRVYHDTPYIEVEWTVGPIPYQGNVGKEVIVNYQTSLNNNKTCYTDSNGRQFIDRVLNYRKTWDFKNTEPVAGNYNPINSAIYIRDVAKNLQMTVLVDRAQGGTSLRNGQVEIMVHRRLLVDDDLGVAEALNERGKDGKGLIARGRHILLFNTTAASPRQMRKMMHQVQTRPTVTVSTATKGVPTPHGMWSGLKTTLPPNVKILSLEGWRDSQILLRLEHIFEGKEDPQFSKPVTVDLSNLFMKMQVTAATELSLGGAMTKKEMTRLKWDSKSGAQKEEPPRSKTSSPLSIILKPMEIKTFALSVKYM